MFALIRFSDTFYLVVPKDFFIPLICPPDISPHPPVYEPTQHPYEAGAQCFNVGFYGIQTVVLTQSVCSIHASRTGKRFNV